MVAFNKMKFENIYWKDSSLFEVSFTTPLEIDEVERAVFEVLRT